MGSYSQLLSLLLVSVETEQILNPLVLPQSTEVMLDCGILRGNPL